MACNHGKNRWTDGQIEWLRKNAPGLSVAEIARRFNRRFRVGVSVGAIRQRMYANGIRNGVDARFKPGRVQTNGLTKGQYYTGCEGGWFKKGGMPHNTAAVGTVVKDPRGYLKVKVGEPKEWVHLHHAIWECLNGPVPEGCVVVFGDKDRMNLSPSNLVCVSRGQLAVMNKRGFIYGDAELTRIGAALAGVKMAAAHGKRKLKKLNHKKGARQDGSEFV